MWNPALLPPDKLLYSTRVPTQLILTRSVAVDEAIDLVIRSGENPTAGSGSSGDSSQPAYLSLWRTRLVARLPVQGNKNASDD